MLFHTALNQNIPPRNRLTRDVFNLYFKTFYPGSKIFVDTSPIHQMAKPNAGKVAERPGKTFRKPSSQIEPPAHSTARHPPGKDSVHFLPRDVARTRHFSAALVHIENAGDVDLQRSIQRHVTNNSNIAGAHHKAVKDPGIRNILNSAYCVMLFQIPMSFSKAKAS